MFSGIRNKKRKIFSPKYKVFQVYKKLEEITPFLQTYHDYDVLNNFEKYVLVIEDRRFFSHNGFDIRAIIRECVKCISRFRKPFGASTIEMQFVRTVTGDYERNFRRKIREIFYAWILNFHASKKVILRSYLENAYFGTGIRGCDEASSLLFQRSVKDLDDNQAAFLAACLVNPIPKDKNANWQTRVRQRAARALAARDRFENIFEQIE